MKSPTKSGKYVAYYRVSTDRQGQSGLGLEAQRAAVMSYLNGGKWELIAEHTEVESGKKSTNRPELLAALARCKAEGATLVIAKLDRLAREVHFISGLIKSDVNFVCCDNPLVKADDMYGRYMLHMLSSFAELEREQISVRTKAALDAARRRGVKLGKFGKELARRNKAAAQENAHSLAPIVAAIRAEGHTTVRAITEQLNARGIQSPRGARWHIPAVHRLLKNMDGRKRRPARRVV